MYLISTPLVVVEEHEQKLDCATLHATSLKPRRPAQLDDGRNTSSLHPDLTLPAWSLLLCFSRFALSCCTSLASEDTRSSTPPMLSARRDASDDIWTNRREAK